MISFDSLDSVMARTIFLFSIIKGKRLHWRDQTYLGPFFLCTEKSFDLPTYFTELLYRVYEV